MAFYLVDVLIYLPSLLTQGSFPHYGLRSLPALFPKRQPFSHLKGDDSWDLVFSAPVPWTSF